MKIIALILFIISITFIIIGFSHQLTPSNTEHREIEFVPRSVFDEISKSNRLS